jgi:hypothetical protein
MFLFFSDLFISVSNIYCKCFIYFERMFEVFYMDTGTRGVVEQAGDRQGRWWRWWGG